MRIFDASDIGEFLTQRGGESVEECKKLAPLVGGAPFFVNVDTRFCILDTGRNALPLTINRREWDNSYVVSPYTHFVSYCKEELRLIDSRLVREVCAALLTGLGALLRRGEINRTVHVNNYALSTNLYPELNADEIAATRDHLVARFPEETIVFRSISAALGPDMLRAFEANGFYAVPTRLVYLQDPKSRETKGSHSFKKDLRLIRRMKHKLEKVTSLSAAEATRLRELYELLYVEKYSPCNPRITEAYLQWAVATGFLSVHMLRDGERIDGMFATYKRGNVLTTPFMGYDTRLPQDLGLFRILTASITLEAERQGLLVHCSAGVGEFKRSRGGVAHVEYSLIYDRHLPWKRRLAWRGLTLLCNTLGKPLMVAYG